MVATDGTQINALGRIVWGHPLKGQQKRDLNTKQVVLGQDGQPVIQHVFGFAIEKSKFLAEIWPAMQTEAAKGFPNGVPNNFSWKIDDGDGIDSNGKPFSDREGYAGHYILTVASNTGFAPNLFKWNGQSYEQLGENDVKCGDFLNVALSFKVNVPSIRTHTPSLYVNPQVIEFVGYGKEIVSAGVNPMTAFGGVQHQLPPGASATPVSGAPAGVAMPGTSAPGMPGQMPQQPAQQPAQPPMQPQPGAPAPMQPVQPGMPAQQMPGMMPPR